MLTKPLDIKAHMRHVVSLMGEQEQPTALVGEQVSYAQRLLARWICGYQATAARTAGRTAKSNDSPTCQECVLTKMQQRGLPKRAQERSTRVIHST